MTVHDSMVPQASTIKHVNNIHIHIHIYIYIYICMYSNGVIPFVHIVVLYSTQKNKIKHCSTIKKTTSQ